MALPPEALARDIVVAILGRLVKMNVMQLAANSEALATSAARLYGLALRELKAPSKTAVPT